MLGIEFIVSLLISATAVYFIRKKLAANKKAKTENIPLRQKDIKRNMKKERKKQNSNAE